VIDNWYAVDDADFPLWRLQVMSALKHALARGAVLAGTSMRPVFPNRAGSATPDYYATPPDPTDMPPGPLPQTMPTSTAEASVEQQLPLWAKTAQVDVSDWAGGERRVSAAMTVAPIELMQLNPQEVVLYLLDQQLSLNANGANIGSVVLRIGTPIGEPLFTFAGDATWGQFFMWVSPHVRAFVPGPLEETIDPTETDPADEVSRLQQAAPALP